jgi:hypothetical protein
MFRITLLEGVPFAQLAGLFAKQISKFTDGLCDYIVWYPVGQRVLPMLDLPEASGRAAQEPIRKQRSLC